MLVGLFAPAESWLHRYVISSAAHGGFPPLFFALGALFAGLASVIRSHMRGVTILPDGIETLDVSILGLPKVQRLSWAMIDRFRFDGQTRVSVELWNGKHEFFPEVSAHEDMVRTLAYVAAARAIPYRGGPQLDELDGDNPFRMFGPSNQS